MDATAPQFRAPAGTIIGCRAGGVLRATGIRYARAERFRPPVAEPVAPAPIVATSPAPACPQAADPLLDEVLRNLFAGITYDEDCLRLSITLPADVEPAEQLPVLVWMHGGSYVTGAGDLPIYDPSLLVREQRVVFVAVTYRLGLLGFLGAAGGPPNLGLLDLREALRWVQRNIAAFGGDPGGVTLLGHSSGGDAIAHLLIAEGCAGLFRRVIIHSAPLGLATKRQAMNRKMVVPAGTFPDDAPVSEVLAREAAVGQAAQGFGLKSGMPFGTQYGACPLPPEAAAGPAWAGMAPQVDVLIGATSQETRFFALASPKFNWIPQVPLLGPALSRLLVRVSSRLIYQQPAREFARRHARAGGRAYGFTVNYHPTGSDFGGAHTIDLPLLLGTPASWAATPLLGRAPWEEVEATGRRVRQLWADFARSGVLPDTVNLPGVLHLQRVSNE